MNNVHFGGFMIQDAEKLILSEAKKIALEKGLNKISIREVAKKSNMSIGTIYNYFPSKAHLIMAIVANYWKEAFMTIKDKLEDEKDFFIGVELIFTFLKENLKDYRKEFLIQMSTLTKDDKVLGRAKEKKFMNYLENRILILIEKDKNISVKTFCNESFSKFVLDNLIINAKKGEDNIAFFQLILKNLLL